MKIEFDPNKSAKNERERGVPFKLAADFDWETALICPDDRRDYGEVRFRAFGFIGIRLHSLVFTAIAGGIRVISLRKANGREVKNYEKNASRTDG